MEETKKEVKELTIEDYKEAYNKLANECNLLYRQLREANMENVFKRLDYLFKVVENDRAFDPEFTNYCTKEIQELIFIKDSPKEETATDNKSEE